jgi:hypothetical protein
MTAAPAVRDLFSIADDQLRLRLHPGQSRAWRSERRFVIVIAGTQSGKTSFLPWWLAREIQRCGPGDYIAATASFDLFKLKFLPVMRNTFEHLLKNGRYWAGDRVIEIADPEKGFLAKQASDPMWARIILRSAAAGSGLESATAKAALLDEAGMDEFSVEDWEAVLRRLSLFRGRVLLGTTPYNLGWLKTQVYDRWTEGDSDFEVIQFHSAMNPVFPKEEQERAKRTMPEWRYRMFYEGEFTRPAGMIYPDFDTEIHTCLPFDVPNSWPRYVGVDFGGANTATLILAHDREADRYFVMSEDLSGDRSTVQHVAAVKERLAGQNLTAAWGGAKSETQPRMDWGTAGLEVLEPRVSDVEAGIDRVTELLKERRLQVFKTCKGLIDEFGSYRRKLDANGQPTEEIENKRAFHRLDALRYVASGLIKSPGYVPLAITGPERPAGGFRFDRGGGW